MAGDTIAPVKCGLPAITAMRQESRYNPRAQTLLQSLQQRPELPLSYATPDGRFRFHYATAGADAVDPRSTNPDGVPDWVYEAGLAAQRAYSLLVDTLGMRPHASDFGVHGPEYDFYITNLSPDYGYTVPEFATGTGPAYSMVDNNYSSGYYTLGLPALRVTVAHEYFHAVQLNYYYRSEDIFFLELSSTWFEDFAYDEVNDYHAYLRAWFQELALPLTHPTGNHKYGSAIWLHYLIARKGTTAVVPALWEQVVSEPAVYAMRTVVQNAPFNLPFAQAVQEFYTWCYFTGKRAEPGRYFPEGQFYPELPFTAATTISLTEAKNLSGSLPALAARHYRFIRTAQDAQFTLQVPVDPGRWKLTAISRGEDGAHQLASDYARVPVSIAAQPRQDTVAVAVANVGVPPNPTQAPTAPYELQARLGQQIQLVSMMEKPRPNPFRPRMGNVVVVPFRVESSTEVEAAIHSEDGRVVWRERWGRLTAGPGEVRWDGRTASGEAAPSGIYLLRLRAGDLMETTKIMLIR